MTPMPKILWAEVYGRYVMHRNQNANGKKKIIRQ